MELGRCLGEFDCQRPQALGLHIKADASSLQFALAQGHIVSADGPYAVSLPEHVVLLTDIPIFTTLLGCACLPPSSRSDFIGSALHLAADSPAGIAAAISDAWQQHNCQVVVCQDAAGSPAVVQAVAAALAAGCSVIAAAATAVSSTTGVSGLTGLRDLAAAAVCNDNGNSSSSQPYVDALATQQQQQCIAAAAAASELWRLLCQHPRRCTVVECQPATHRCVEMRLSSAVTLLGLSVI